jgi:error-prone DNA polymerase
MTDNLAYMELETTTNFSFLRGASHAEELVGRAVELGHCGAVVTDRNTLAGIVRGHAAAKQAGLPFVPGCRLVPEDGPEILAFPRDRAAYGRLSQLLTLGSRRAPKGDCWFGMDDVFGPIFAAGQNQVLVVVPPDIAADEPVESFVETLATIRRRVHQDTVVWLAAHYLYQGDDDALLARLSNIAKMTGVPLVATNDVHAHDPARRALQDVLTCIREHTIVAEAGFRLQGNGERHLKSPAEMSRLFAACPEAVARSAELTKLCTFNLEELAYEYPEETVSPGETPQSELIKLTWEGAARRYPDGIPDKIHRLVEHELDLIGGLNYAPYFLTVNDIVCFARARSILCQGRGSAANSAVCYCLGITAVDPDRVDLLFERFISAERNEPPDIDVDFEHERREEVIQYIYQKYGRDRAALAATVVTYRMKSAVRQISKALGLSEDVGAALAGMGWSWSKDGEFQDHRIREVGLDPDDPRLRQALELASEIRGFPRHLSQHVGGFVMTRGPLSAVVPIANAAMEDRTVIEWDKDDLDTLGILKVDVLALGMLSCIRRAFGLIEKHHGRSLTLATVPAEDPRVYDMLGKGDSVGVFQVESRAQMSMLPRLKPRNFYDLVIEVAIVRPGPIQGDMVHPYLRRRNGEEQVNYPSKELEAVLGKTLGVPLFQEQAMKIAVVGAGFTPSEADGLRRAMATFRKTGKIHGYGERFINGMLDKGYDEEFASRCFRQIEGFGEYGFPESHAASFALLVYVSAWLKCHYPTAFAAALLNSQPMGFYAPAQIVRDAREHGAVVRPVDVNHSNWDCTLEPLGVSKNRRPARGRNAGQPGVSNGGGGRVALRLGLRQIKGLREDDAQALVAHRGIDGQGSYADVADLWHRSGLGPKVLDRLARADAFASMELNRRDALWAVRGLGDTVLPLFAAAEAREARLRNSTRTSGNFQVEPDVTLPLAQLGEQVIDDYAATRLSLKAHPLKLLRRRLQHRGFISNEALPTVDPDSAVRLAGLVISRQRPGTASGVIFATLEDETGVANIIVWPKVFEKFRKVVLRSRLLGVTGVVQREGRVIHVIARHLGDYSFLLDELDEEAENEVSGKSSADPRHFPSRDFH